MNAPARQDVVILAFKAWAIGLLAVALIGLPLAAIPGAGSGASDRLGAFLAGYPRAVLSALVLVSTIGATLSAPLFALGLGVGVLARRQIARYPLVFVVLALVVTVVLSGVVALPVPAQGDAVARFMAGVVSVQTLVFLSGVLPAVWYFCTRLARRAASA